MEVILKKNVSNLGYTDDLVVVKPGYGSNFLIPQGYAILATESAKKVRTETLRQRAHKQEKEKNAALEMAAKLKDITLKVGAKAGETGKIFGSVNALQLADALKKAGYQIERRSISIVNEPIKELGTYEAKINFYRGVSETINFEVVAE